MGRKATGSVYWLKDDKGVFRLHTRVLHPDGSRPYEPIPAEWATKDTPESRALAKAVAAELSARIHGKASAQKLGRETVREWFGRFHAHKGVRGLESVGDMRGRAERWIFPTIGHKAMRDVTADDIEDIVQRLDGAIIAWQEADGGRGEGRLASPTAANVWGDLQHAFDEAVRSKDRSLRVLPASPCAKVRGPETGDDREGPILYSDEILSLLRGVAIDEGERDVPVYRRRVYAMAIYTMARRSELAALTAADVDLAHATITISKQVDRKKKAETKKTKTKRTRTIDIEPAVMALVRLLVDEAPAGRMVRVPPAEDCAELLRKDLWTVGARDPRLHTEDSTRTKMRFHDLRDTGLTHMAVRGDSPIVIQWRGGHTTFGTTQGYIDRGRVEARRIGVPLPEVPRLAESENKGQNRPAKARAVAIYARSLGNSATPTGIEPVLPT